jgi:Icc-related predicted phosphoesterase
MRIAAISDVHGKWNKLGNIEPCDILISAGDYSFTGEKHMVEDFHKWLNKQPTKHIISVQGNHECLDKYTELLTNRGWIKYSEININDKVLSINSYNEAVWTHINKVIVTKAKYIYTHQNKMMDIAITENHRIPYYYFHQYQKKFSELQYGTVNNIHSSVNIPVASKNNNVDCDILDDEIRLLGWILTDGSCTSKNDFYIYQSKPDGISKIINILNNLNYKYTLKFRHRDIQEICGKKLKSIRPQGEFRIKSESSNLLRKYIKPGKQVNKELFNKFSSNQMQILLMSMMDGDGSWHKTRTCGALNGTKEFLDWVQTLAVQCGIRSSIIEYRSNNFRLNLSFNRDKIIIHQFSKKFKKIQYNDDVWCLSVPHTNFMIRRNGKACFTGNCFIDKMPQPVRGRISSLTFAEAKELAQSVCPRVHFIGDGETVVIDGIKIHGSACTPFFHAWAWNRFSHELKEEWAKIPDDTDILVTHGPPYGILDTVNFADGTPKSEHLGCQHLMDRIMEIKPDLHICGHIHSSYGQKHHEGVSFYNVSNCDEMYVASNPITYIDYEKD